MLKLYSKKPVYKVKLLDALAESVVYENKVFAPLLFCTMVTLQGVFNKLLTVNKGLRLNDDWLRLSIAVTCMKYCPILIFVMFRKVLSARILLFIVNRYVRLGYISVILYPSIVVELLLGVLFVHETFKTSPYRVFVVFNDTIGALGGSADKPTPCAIEELHIVALLVFNSHALYNNTSVPLN